MKRLLLFLIVGIIAHGTASPKGFNERLMFVGEPTKVLTIATGRPEMPEEAPAIADVITSKEIEAMGGRTLGEVLSTEPGFLVLPKESGFSLYTRGVKSGALLLYDGIPLTTESTKSVYPLGEELDLDTIKRVEIIRGPASVLWGPDAFAGVVNLVLKKGRDINGVRIRTTGGAPWRYRGFSLLMGKDWGWADCMGFARYVRRQGFLGGKNQEFMEAGAKLSLNDELEVVGRVSQYRRPYTTKVSTIYGERKWTSRQDIPFGLLKVAYTKRLKHTSISAKVAYSQWNIAREEGNYSFGYKDRNWYGELKVTRELFEGSGLLTVGASVRRNFVSNALISIKGYIPEYIASGTSLSPLIERKSFDSTLRSAFAQYVHRWDSVEVWLGGRVDDHSEYKTTFSYTLGAGWNVRKGISVKLSAGTAYRTPYAYHFLRKKVDPEKISNVSLKIEARHGEHILSLIPFASKVEDHVSEDPYAGYSGPRDYSISGIELSWRYAGSRLLAWVNYTLFGTSGAREKYKVLDYIIVTPDETVAVYSRLSKDVDTGSKHFASAGIAYRLSKSTFVSLKGTYRGKVCYKMLRNGESLCSSPEVMVDAFVKHRLSKNTWVELKAENLLNMRREYKGVFSRFRRGGFSLYFSLKASF